MNTWFFRILLLLLPLSSALAQDYSAVQWLQRIYSATQKLNYIGTFIYQQGTEAESSRIVHVVDASGTHERLETLDGMPREVLRNKDEVVCYLPTSGTMKIDRQPGWRWFPSLLPPSFSELEDHYSLRKEGIERVAGYDCQVIVLEPKDRMRYGHRLWADAKTGMLLKARTFDERNGLVEQFTFTQLQIGGIIESGNLKSRLASRTRDWRVENSEAVQVNPADKTWVFKTTPPGFHAVAEMTRTVGGTSGVRHIVLSDGFASVSVFIEPVADKRRAVVQAGPIRKGPINIYVRPLDSYRVTVVGETPLESVKYIAEAVEYRR